ncbi:MAG: hypothetical protein ACFFG0_19090 [Candidatus Thorarchaeota archaeon]
MTVREVIMKKLTESHVISAKEKCAEIEKPILERINYIIKYICDTYGAGNFEWSFWNVELTEYGLFLYLALNEEYIYYRLVPEKIGVDFKITFENNLSMWLNECFPTRWLFEDFEEELLQGKQKAMNITKCKMEEMEKDIIRKQALAKLTDEERKILGVK